MHTRHVHSCVQEQTAELADTANAAAEKAADELSAALARCGGLESENASLQEQLLQLLELQVCGPVCESVCVRHQCLLIVLVLVWLSIFSHVPPSCKCPAALVCVLQCNKCTHCTAARQGRSAVCALLLVAMGR